MSPEDAAFASTFFESSKGAHAHATLKDAIEDFRAEIRGKRPKGAPDLPWEVLEHMRIAQWDILESPGTQNMRSGIPDGYRPENAEPPTRRPGTGACTVFLQGSPDFLRPGCRRWHRPLCRIPGGDVQIFAGGSPGRRHNSYHLGHLFFSARPWCTSECSVLKRAGKRGTHPPGGTGGRSFNGLIRLSAVSPNEVESRSIAWRLLPPQSARRVSLQSRSPSITTTPAGCRAHLAVFFQTRR